MSKKKWTYYNDSDPKCCAWVRELIRAGEIQDGEVDNRSISDVKPSDIQSFRRVHFFCGIAGWELALRLAGVPDDYPVWTGSCPCQPFSVAGEGMGEADERHLWPDFRNLIGECRPAIVFGEQVARKAGFLWLAGVRADLESAGYVVGASDLCAAGVGSPHIRQRIYWMAYTAAQGSQRDLPETGGIGMAFGLAKRQQQLERHGSTLPVADCEQSGCEGRVSGWENQERENLDGHSGCGSATGGMGDTERLRLDTGIAGVRPGQEGQGGAHRPISDRPAGFWDESVVIGCKDGKNRRIPVEPGFFPLAHGVSGRVGLLRGYGNAIIPPLAKEFIQASIEAIKLQAIP